MNLGAAVMLLAMLRIAAKPADDSHAYGHSKAEYFASGFEGMLVVVAAVAIVYSASSRLFHPQPLEQAGAGLALTPIASALNLVVAQVLMRTGRRHRSIQRLRHRLATPEGIRRWVDGVPDKWTAQQGHELVEEIERHRGPRAFTSPSTRIWSRSRIRRRTRTSDSIASRPDRSEVSSTLR